jgi:hypothetical protein
MARTAEQCGVMLHVGHDFSIGRFAFLNHVMRETQGSFCGSQLLESIYDV